VEVPSLLPLLALAPAAIAIPLIVLCDRRSGIRDAWSVGAAVIQTGLVGAMVREVQAGLRPTWQGEVWLAPGVPLVLRADPLGVLFATVASGLWVVTTIYSIGYTRALAEPAQTRYFGCFALCLFATTGLALAGNLLTFFCFFELITIAAYPLVAHHGTPEANRAGRVYLAYTLTGGAALLAAIAGTHALAGHGDFQPGGILPAEASTGALWGLFWLFVVGCGVKAAIVPLHTWLPVAMIAPTPVSALLHAVAVVKAGVFGFVRVVGFVFGTGPLAELGAASVLVGLAAATVVLGSLAALAQDNLKRLLAFSTVSQLAYVVLGAGVGVEEALAGGVLHIASHAVLKITLFFCAGAVYATTHLDRVSQLDGIGRRMPLTMTAFAVAALLLAGLPPGPAFLSKWRLLVGAAESGVWVAVGALLASTVLNVAYFAPIIVRAFAEPASGPRAEARPALLVPLLLTAAAGLILGLAPDAVVPLLSLADDTALGTGGVP
jgi:multicomponent Na+:H+ antiporter subunit D